MQAPIARIGNVLARHGFPQGRSPSWMEDAKARQIAHINEAILALRVR